MASVLYCKIDTFMLLDAPARHNAKLFLEQYDMKARRKGRDRFRRRELGQIGLTINGVRTPVEVESVSTGRAFSVELHHENGAWRTECQCKAPLCEHSYAAFLVLFMNTEAQEEEQAPSKSKNLEDTVVEALGRSLKPNEKRFVERIRHLSTVAASGRTIRKWDIQDLVSSVWFQVSDHVPTTKPVSEASFWQDLARYILLAGGNIPSFMQGAVDYDAIERERALVKRREAIRHWEVLLRSIPEGDLLVERKVAEFRLVISGHILKIVHRLEPDAKFQPLHSRGLSKLSSQITNGEVLVAPDSLPIFQAFTRLAFDYSTVEMNLHERSARMMLGTLLRLPPLREHIYTDAGEPFKWAAEKLQWQMRETGEDYSIELVKADGSRVEEIIAYLPGKPSLYLTQDSIYEGPFRPPNLGETNLVIPAPAMETESGLRFIRSLELPLPARIKERTREATMVASIRCSLVHDSYSDIEYCYFDVEAKASEGGRTEKFLQSGWMLSGKVAEKAGNNRPFYIYDRAQLEKMPSILERIGAGWQAYEERWRIKVNKNFPDKFLEWCRSIPPEIPVHLDPILATLVRDPVRATVQLDCQEAGVDWFDLKTTINVQDTSLTQEELQLLLNAKGKAVRLPGKGWRRLEYQLTDQEEECLSRLGLSAYDLSSEPQRLHALQLAEQAAEKMLAAEQFRKIQSRAHEIKARVSPPVPAVINATLRPYQVEGFHFLAYLSENSFGGILADDMGLGKTIQALCWLTWLRENRSPSKPDLVICPKSVMDNWISESAKFAPHLRVSLWRGTDPASLPKIATESDMLVMNYAQLRALGDGCSHVQWNAVILDEAQAIKNPESQTAQAARSLPADYRLALSGTPIENRLLDLWSIMAFAMPGILGNRTDFKRRFDGTKDPFARKRLAARVRPFLLRRTKNQVASELPDRVEEDLFCELEGIQKTLYRAEFKRAQQMLLQVKTQAELNEFRFHFLTSLLRLRQICCHPGLIDEEKKTDESAKLNALLELLDPLVQEGHKVIVFSQFVGMLKLIQEELEIRQWKSLYLAGETENRGELVREFQEREGSTVFLISLKAGGFGLNLTAASYVVLFDPWWNPAVENQAIDRTHRIGQTQKVMAYRLLIKGSIEEKIRMLQKQKSAIAEDVLGDEAFSSRLTLDDFKFLFADDAEMNR